MSEKIRMEQKPKIDDDAVQQHPLQNHVIMEILFSFLPSTIHSVRKRRLVCKAWHTACAAEWKSFTTPVTIYQDDASLQRAEVALKGPRGTTENRITLEMFLERKGLNDAKFQCHNFHLEEWIMKDCHIIRTPFDRYTPLDKNQFFWSNFGKNMTQLTLSQCSIPHHYKIFDTSFWTSVPNLEMISFVNVSVDEAEMVGHRAVENAAENHQRVRNRLKSIRIENVYHSLGGLSPIPWARLLLMSPQLEEIVIRNQRFDWPHNGISIYGNARNLRYLDLMNLLKVRTADDIPIASCSLLRFPWMQLSLHKLTLDCGLDLERREDIRKIVERQAGTLKELHLYRTYCGAPYSSFPCDIVMDHLTELCLWGNVARNLNFLKLTPNLEVFKWNTSCYNGDSHGTIHVKHLANGFYPLWTTDIVENTDGFDTEFRLEKLEHLELDCEVMSLLSWRKLGRWLPNVVVLKGTFIGDENLTEIFLQWANLERLEIGHGSEITADGILEASMRPNNAFKMLKEFIWKPCSCIQTPRGEDEMKAEHQLRKYAKRNVTLPWIQGGYEVGEKGKFDCEQRGTCLQGLFQQLVQATDNASKVEITSLYKNVLNAKQ